MWELRWEIYTEYVIIILEMIYIYKEKNNTYYFQILLEDSKTGKVKRYKRRGFSSEIEARKAAMKFSVNEKNIVNKGLTFDFIIDEFLKFKKVRVSDRSLHKFERTIDLYIRPYTKDLYMNNYSSLDAEKYYNTILSLNHAPEYMNMIIAQFKKLFKFAHDYYNLQNDPVSRLEYRKTIIKPIEIQELYTIEEFKQYLNYFDDSISMYEKSFKLFFIILFFTGLRRGEAKALRWNDIDFERKIINVDEQAIDKDRNVRVLITKTLKNPQSYRKVPIDDNTLKSLRDLKEMRSNDTGFSIDDFIFLRNNLIKLPFADSTIYNRNLKAAKSTNVKYINIHGFRHSYASNMLSMGVPLTAVSEALGHSSISVTEKVYAHAINRDREILAMRLNEMGNSNIW